MTKILKGVAARLGEEIERLGVSHLARVLGVARNTLYNWVDQGNVPVNRLAELGDAGVDVAYVLTGDRAALHDALSKVRVATMIAERLGKSSKDKSAIQEAVFSSLQAPLLDASERQLLDDYRRADRQGQSAIRTTAAALASGAGPPVASSVNADRGGIAAGRDANVGTKSRRSRK